MRRAKDRGLSAERTAPLTTACHASRMAMTLTPAPANSASRRAWRTFEAEKPPTRRIELGRSELAMQSTCERYTSTISCSAGRNSCSGSGMMRSPLSSTTGGSPTRAEWLLNAAREAAISASVTLSASDGESVGLREKQTTARSLESTHFDSG